MPKYINPEPQTMCNNFNKLYSKLVDAEAEKELVLYFNDKPYAFKVIYIEVVNKTKMGLEMLQKLRVMGLI